MNKNTVNRIANQNRHEFIYMKDNEERQNAIKHIMERYKITCDENKPSAIFVEEPFLPNLENEYTENNYLTKRIAREYLNLSIANSIISELTKRYSLKELNIRLKILLKKINVLFKNKETKDIEDIGELLHLLKQIKQIYKTNYLDIYNSLKTSPDVLNLPISFIIIDQFIYYLKKDLNNSSHIAVLIDTKQNTNIYSEQAINQLIAQRINHNLSMKVFCDPKDWRTINDLNGGQIDLTHDYGIIEIDDSHQNYLNEIKSKYIKY